jgi:hypothetical protein
MRQRQHLHAVSIAAVVLGGVSLFGGRGSAIGAIFGAFAFRTIGDLLFVFDFDPLWQPLFQGVVLLLPSASVPPALFRCATVWIGSDERHDPRHARFGTAAPQRSCAAVDPAVATAFGCIVLLLFVGSLYSPNFLSPEYLLQQLKVGVVPRRHRHRHDAGHPARPDRPVGALDGDDRGAMMASRRRLFGPDRASSFAIPFGISAASPSASSTASASPICASRR